MIVQFDEVRPSNISVQMLDTSLYEALTSSWSLNSASIILVTGQIGFTFLELA